MPTHLTSLRFITGLLILACIAGCSKEPFQHVQISGKVTYEDGSLIPAELIELTFQPMADAIDAKTHPRPGRAEVDVATGEFSRVTTHKPGDGVVAGSHKVKITAYDESQGVSKAIPEVRKCSDYADLFGFDYYFGVPVVG